MLSVASGRSPITVQPAESPLPELIAERRANPQTDLISILTNAHDEGVLVTGFLGAGKTTFVRGLVRGLGVTGDITSPSFALLNVYDGQRQVFHVDAYRLTRPEAFDDLLIWDLAKSPWNVIVEWPEKVAARLPSARWQMKTAILADGGHRFQLTLAG